MPDMDDNPFDASDPIFETKKPLKEDSFTPDTIFHRDEELKHYTNALKDIVVGHDPNNVFLYGPTGVGKTVATNYMCDKLAEIAAEKGIPLHIIGPINCRNYESKYTLAVNMVNEFRDPDDKIPKTGHSTDQVFDFLFEEIEDVGGNVLLILDEIDNIPPEGRNDILYEIPRAESTNTPVDEAKIGLIGISNNLKFVDVLEPKVRSTLSEREIEFHPYDANELRDILQYYADIAFKDGVLTDDVIPLAAAWSAQERGDARQGLRILEKAGDIARMEEDEKVTEKHTREATETIQTDEILEYFEQNLTNQQALSYIATTLAVIDPDIEPKIDSIFQLYNSAAEQRGSDPRTQRRMYEFVNQLAMQGLVRSEEENYGVSGGRRFLYDVTDDPEDIIDAALRSTYDGALPDNIEEFLDGDLQIGSSQLDPSSDNTSQSNLWEFSDR
jgi:cell division control protein 6